MQLQIPRFAKSQNYFFLHSPALLSDFAQLVHYVGPTDVIMLADDVDRRHYVGPTPPTPHPNSLQL